MFYKRKNGGFTMIEVLLSVIAITIIAGITIPLHLSFSSRTDLSVATTTVVNTLRRAQTLSAAIDGDDSWGVKVQTGDVIIFKGSSFALRDNSYDELYDVSEGISFTGISEVVFSKFEGLPNTTGTITLTSTTNNSKDVTINPKGTISY
jgi:prepilin-type N-terminal cleavage/methylation domain-containing protein